MKRTEVKKAGTLLLEAVVVLGLAAVLTWSYFGFNNIAPGQTISFGGDEITSVSGIKNILTGSDRRLGWPFAIQTPDYGAKYGMMRLVFIHFCGLFTRNVITVFNAVLFIVPVFNVFVSYWALRGMHLRRWLAFLAAVAFGLCPYVQYRDRGHGALAAIECIPLVFLLCFWCIEDPNFNRPGRQWFRYRRNWAALALAWMIADNGMVYYPYFSCFVFCVVAFCMLLHKKSWKAVMAPLVTLVQVVGWVALAFMPTVIGMFAGAGNAATAGAKRGPTGAMLYSLRLNSLLLSPKGYGSKLIAGLVADYNRVSAAVEQSNFNENAYAYMGIVAIVGFLLLLLLLFVGNHEKTETLLSQRLWYLSRIQIAILLLSLQSSFGTLIGAFLREMRCYNRISPFLVFGGVLAVALCAQALLDRFCPAGAAPGWRGWLAAASVLVLFGYGIWEQQGCYNYISGGTQKHIDSDTAFVQAIEKDAGDGAVIFQLPYMLSFENGNAYHIPDYDHVRGVLYSDTLKWSYGAAEGTANDVWYRETSQLPPEELVAELKAQGLAGIWLNLDGYTPEEGAALESALCAAAGCTDPIRCADGHTIYIGIQE